jgi:glycosidase
VTAAIEDGTLTDLGVTTLWLSPIVANAQGVEVDKGHNVSAYHGYWPTKAREIDPRYGTSEELEALVAAAHRKGIRVLLDYVINHVHEDHEYFTQHPDWFRTGCNCGTANCGWTEKRLECLFHEYMPDIDWSNREAAEQFVADAVWWLERYDLDGLRVDAVKHVEDAAIANLAIRIRESLEGAGTEVFLIGETAMGWAGHSLEANKPEYGTISHYIGPDGLTGQFDFVLYHSTSYRVWAYDEYGLLHADYWTKASLANYPADAVMTPFIGSHDNPRFISMASKDPNTYNDYPEDGLPGMPSAQGYARAAVAFTWLLSLPGAPLLYYGDEYGEYGGADPDNRHMWRGPAQRSAAEKNLHTVISRVGQARRASPALRRGDYQTLLAEESFLAFGRRAGADLAVVIVNRSAAPATRTITLPAGTTAASFSDALSPGTTVPVTAGKITVTIPAFGSMILL